MKPDRGSNGIATNDGQASDVFIITKEYCRFAEFCDACRRYRYIGLCYGLPGVGKTVSARHYADWDRIKGQMPAHDADTAALMALLDSHTIFYTPAVVNSPGQVECEIGNLRYGLRSILLEERERKQRQHFDTILWQENAEEEERQRRFLTEADWFADSVAPKPPSKHALLAREYGVDSREITDPTSLVINDEADRLKMASLEQVRSIFDQVGIGVVLIGMPGIEKRLARYPQLYSRVGFVHAFRPLTAAEVGALLLEQNWRPAGVALSEDAVADKEALAAVSRITGGNFRLLDRLVAQIARGLATKKFESVMVWPELLG